QQLYQLNIISPRLLVNYALCQRSVFTLHDYYITGRSHRPLAQARFSGQMTNRGQHFRGQQTRIEYARSIQRRITETYFVFGFFRSIKIVQDKVADRARKGQVFIARENFGGFAQCARGERGWHNRGRASRREEGARLPSKVVAPRSAAVAFQAHPNQIVEQLARLGFSLFGWITAIVSERREREQRDRF